MSMLPEDKMADDVLLRAINSFNSKNPDESREKLYKSIDNLLQGIDTNNKVKMVLDESSGLKIRFIDNKFKTDLRELAKALKNAETPENTKKHAKYDDAIKLITIQVQKGDVIYQVGQARATASTTALDAYTQEKKAAQKSAKAVRTLNAATQSLIANTIASKFLAIIAPREASLLSPEGVGSSSKTAATASIAARFFPQGQSTPITSAGDTSKQKAPSNSLLGRHKISLGAPDQRAKMRQERQKEALEDADKTRRDEDKRSERRQDNTQADKKAKRDRS